MITGITHSRLNELVKYGTISSFENMYRQSNTTSIDGVNYGLSTPNQIIYYFGGITYTDDVESGVTVTTYSYPPTELNYGGEDALRIYKDPKKIKIRNNPTLINDLNIERQEISVFNEVYKLSYLDNLEEVLSYAGGKYFNIINNM